MLSYVTMFAAKVLLFCRVILIFRVQDKKHTVCVNRVRQSVQLQCCGNMITILFSFQHQRSSNIIFLFRNTPR